MKNLLIILALIVIAAGCGKNGGEERKETETAKKEEPKTEQVTLSKESAETIGLETKEAGEEYYKGFLKVPAVIVSDQNFEAQVGPVVSGKVKQVYASVGTYVSAGQTLMLIEGLEIGVLKADFLKAKATLDFTEQEYSRQKALMEQNAGSQKNYISAKAEYEKSLAEFNAMDKKIHSIGLKDDDVIKSRDDLHSSGDLPVKSPISGVIVERNVVVGQYMEPSSVAFKILNNKSLLIDGQVYENDLKKLGEGMQAEFVTPSLPDEVFLCDITFRGQSIDEKTRTVKIRAKVNNARNKLLPQMFGELRIPSGENMKGIFVPEESIVKIENRDYIFVRTSDTTFEKRAVTAGMKKGPGVEITEGLKAGEKYVTSGAFYLKSELLKESLGGDED